MAVGASVAWGASDFVAGLAARRRSLLLVLGGSQLTGLVLMALSVAVAGAAMPSGDALGLAAGAGICEVAGFALLYRALSSGPMGPVAPVAALGGLVPLAAHLLAGDRLTTSALVGLGAALTGIGLVSWDGAGAADREPVTTRAVLLAAGSALAFGTFFLLLEQASVEDGDPLAAVTVSRFFAVMVTLPLLAFALRTRTPGTVGLRSVLVIGSVGLLDIGANTLYAVGASQAGGSSSLAVIASTYPVATVALAQLVLRERMTRVQAAGAALTLVAVLLVGGV